MILDQMRSISYNTSTFTNEVSFQLSTGVWCEIGKFSIFRGTATISLRWTNTDGTTLLVDIAYSKGRYILNRIGHLKEGIRRYGLGQSNITQDYIKKKIYNTIDGYASSSVVIRNIDMKV